MWMFQYCLLLRILLAQDSSEFIADSSHVWRQTTKISNQWEFIPSINKIRVNIWFRCNISSDNMRQWNRNCYIYFRPLTFSRSTHALMDITTPARWTENGIRLTQIVVCDQLIVSPHRKWKQINDNTNKDWITNIYGKETSVWLNRWSFYIAYSGSDLVPFMFA